MKVIVLLVTILITQGLGFSPPGEGGPLSILNQLK